MRCFLRIQVQLPAPNVFMISALELVLSLICSLPAIGGVPKLLGFLQVKASVVLEPSDPRLEFS
jgi:hypothetical protein